MKRSSNILLASALFVSAPLIRSGAQAPAGSTMPVVAPANLYMLPPDYPMPYGPVSVSSITQLLNRVHTYLDAHTPARIVDRTTGAAITDLSAPSTNAILERGHFQIISYEWGVTYSGMLLAWQNTGDARFRDYALKRLQFVVDQTPYFRALQEAGLRGRDNAFRAVLQPGALDDAGSMCAALIKAQEAGLTGARPLIDRYADYILTKQHRLSDGTLARKRPMMDSIWLDDLYMSVPALAQTGKLTGDRKYFDDAVKQVRQFSDRMFDRESGLYMHGWIAGMQEHPRFRWACANGWALMAMTELLEVLPQDHPERASVLEQLRAHIHGLATCQGHAGLWHQLLDRNDSYMETSASAIFTFCIARAINRGWVDPLAYGPVALLGWNAVSAKVTAQGQIEGTCVGTGMGFDPAFYYYRPQSVFAAHGYGPVLLAGAEMIQIATSNRAVLHDNAVQFDRPPANLESAR
jgi:rhamnogalacturonyl hydrolase YesR